MTEQEATDLHDAYFTLLGQHSMVLSNLDYSIVDQHTTHLQKLADIGNSTITIFDFYQKRHIFRSNNIGDLLGYNFQSDHTEQELLWNSIIHPEDYTILVKNGVVLLNFFRGLSAGEKHNYKLISEFRVLNADNKYVRVIEQQQALETTDNGDLWLALSVLDISPNQRNLDEGTVSELLNFRTGKIVPFTEQGDESTISLTKREVEVLKLVKDGLLSKEISDRLAISMHTVNTHRQRVLYKLGVNNSMEAVKLASNLGLI